ncbi:universal stress protein [Rhodoferax aquaticus]|nr:universal stress protein [Rhodoferax aquaticus]
MFKHILLPTDGSEASQRAVESGARLANALGAKLTLVSALDPLPLGVGSAASLAEDSPMHSAARSAAQHWLTQAQTLVQAQGQTAQELIVQERSIYQSIIAAAASTGADLIVMGTHGAGALERFLVGSQTQRVLAHTNLPVLVFR